MTFRVFVRKERLCNFGLVRVTPIHSRLYFWETGLQNTSCLFLSNKKWTWMALIMMSSRIIASFEFHTWCNVFHTDFRSIFCSIEYVIRIQTKFPYTFSFHRHTNIVQFMTCVEVWSLLAGIIPWTSGELFMTSKFPWITIYDFLKLWLRIDLKLSQKHIDQDVGKWRSMLCL